MSLRFVSTEVLSSTDGLSHGETTTLETEEVAAAKRLQASSSGQTLYDQLEAEKAKQQEAYDANTKAIFAPNQALDDEDVEFFEAEKRRRASAVAARDEIEASEFASARASLAARAPEAPPAVKIAAAPPKAPARSRSSAAPAAAQVKIRRRPATETRAPEPKKAKVAEPAPAAPNPLASLACYGGSSDSEGDEDD